MVHYENTELNIPAKKKKKAFSPTHAKTIFQANDNLCSIESNRINQ